MRLLIAADVAPLDEGSGAERLLQAHARELARRGHEVRIVFRAAGDGGERPPTAPAAPNAVAATPGASSSKAAAVANRHEVLGCRLYPYTIERAGSIAFLRSTLHNAGEALAEATRGWRPDAIDIHQPFTGYALLRRVADPAPILYTFLSPAPAEFMRQEGYGGLRGRIMRSGIRWVEDAVLRRAATISVLSDFMKGEIRAWHRAIPVERIVRIPGGVDTETFVPPADRDALRAELGYPPDRKLLLTVRNLEPRTGVGNLIEAVIELAARRRDFLLLVAGRGPLAADLRDRVGRAGIDDVVRFLGFVDEVDLVRYYGVADLYIQPDTDLQGFGLPIVEAMACGTPVLATPVGGAVDILKAIDPRLLFSALRPEAIAAELSTALDDPDLLGDRRSPRRIAEERFAWPRIVDRVEEVLEALRHTPHA